MTGPHAPWRPTHQGGAMHGRKWMMWRVFPAVGATLALAAGNVGCGAPDEPSSGADRPVGGVMHAELAVSPAPGKVRVPFGGLRDGACVHEVQNGSVVDSDGTERVNGVVTKRHALCVDTSGAAPAVTLPQGAANWVEASWMNAIPISPYQEFNKVTGTWTVPPDPTGNDNQLLYYFI